MLGNNFSKTSQREEGERDPSLVGQDRDRVRRRRHQRFGTQQHRVLQVRSKMLGRDFFKDNIFFSIRFPPGLLPVLGPLEAVRDSYT